MSSSDRELFERALAASPRERAALLELCADTAQRARVEALLAAGERMDDGFLERPAVQVLSTVGRVGRRLGDYRIDAEIGRGGMGAVYLASRADAAFVKRVAIKVVAAPFGDAELLARFRRERQILAELDHPNICGLLDGGTTEDGLPFLVMEHVEGVRIDRYCREHALPLEARIELFLQICDAVQYAHSRLVVHCDLKPQNILVRDDGRPILLDFGIARLLPSDEGAPASATLGALTPEYASPEQIRGARPTTASDVYSLGVVLYELLVGRRPHERERPAEPTPVGELFRIVGTEEPVRPSLLAARSGEHALARSLRGDLDAILLEALRKIPDERYSSVSALSDDLRGHLAGLPVVARGNRLAYRARSFVRRHRLGVAVAAALTATLVAGIVATSWQARIAQAQRREAEAQRQRAEQRFADVRRLANSFLFEFHDAIATLPGSTNARKLVVSKALEYLDLLAGEAHDDRSLQAELAEAYDRVGDVQGNPGVANLGDPEGALASYRKAEEIRRALAADATDPSALLGLATSHARIGDALMGRGAVGDAVASYREALVLREGILAAAGPEDLAARRGVIEAVSRLCTSLIAVGEVEGALDACRRSIALADGILESGADDLRVRTLRATAGIAYGNALRLVGEAEAAEEAFDDAIARQLVLLAADPNNTEVRRRLSVAYGYLANVQLHGGRAGEAAAALEQGIAQLSALVEADPANVRSVPELAYVLNRRAQLLVQLGRSPEARRDAGRALELLRASASRPEAGGDALNEYAWALVSTEPAELRDPDLALEYANRALTIAGENPVYLHTLAWAHYRSGRTALAKATLERALAALPAPGPEPATGLRQQIETDLARFEAPSDS